MIMEGVVRPFQLVSVTPPRRVIAAEKIVPNVLIDIGKPGSGLCFTYNLFFFLDFTVADDHTHTEVSRVESTRHVTNPDDSSQFVDTKVLDQVHVRKQSDPTNYNIYKFNNPSP